MIVSKQEEKQERTECKAVTNDEPGSSELSELSELEDSEDNEENEESEEDQARRGTDIESDGLAEIVSDDDGDSSTTDSSSLKISELFLVRLEVFIRNAESYRSELLTERNNRAAVLDLAVSRAFASKSSSLLRLDRN